jgi:hypothetical protein
MLKLTEKHSLLTGVTDENESNRRIQKQVQYKKADREGNEIVGGGFFHKFNT